MADEYVDAVPEVGHIKRPASRSSPCRLLSQQAALQETSVTHTSFSFPFLFSLSSSLFLSPLSRQSHFGSRYLDTSAFSLSFCLEPFPINHFASIKSIEPALLAQRRRPRHPPSLDTGAVVGRPPPPARFPPPVLRRWPSCRFTASTCLSARRTAPRDRDSRSSPPSRASGWVLPRRWAPWARPLPPCAPCRRLLSLPLSG